MPKAYAATKKGKLIQWLRNNPGRYRSKTLAHQHHVSRGVVLAALQEAESNGWAERCGMGRNTYWRVWRLG